MGVARPSLVPGDHIVPPGTMKKARRKKHKGWWQLRWLGILYILFSRQKKEPIIESYDSKKTHTT